jgi:putative membrane protein
MRVIPTGNFSVQPGGTATITVIALRAGEDGNLPAGSIMRPDPAIPGVTVEQAAPLTGGTNTPLWFIFLAGAIAICAMILPGVSGSFLLLMLGQYGYILHKVYSLVYERNTDVLSIVLVFIGGIIVGILAFSRLLNFLLERYHDLTMAALTGLMIGSLRKLWPFREFEGQNEINVLPGQFDSTTGITIACFAAGFLVIVVMTLLSRNKENTAS